MHCNATQFCDEEEDDCTCDCVRCVVERRAEDAELAAATIESRDATIAALTARAEAAEARIRVDEETTCRACGEAVEPFAGNPMRWPIPFVHPDDSPGEAHIHHIGCVTERIRVLTARVAEVEREAERMGYAAAIADVAAWLRMRRDGIDASLYDEIREAIERGEAKGAGEVERKMGGGR